MNSNSDILKPGVNLVLKGCLGRASKPGSRKFIGRNDTKGTHLYAPCYFKRGLKKPTRTKDNLEDISGKESEKIDLWVEVIEKSKRTEKENSCGQPLGPIF